MKQPLAPFLIKSERNFLETLQRGERDKRISDRIRVILLLDKKWSYENIAQALFLDRSTVQRYYEEYGNKEKKEFLTLNYAGRNCKLNGEALKEVKNYVEETTPTTGQEVVEYLKQNHGVEYTVSGVISLLHRLNFVYKKPKLQPGKANGEAQKEFIEQLKKEEEKLDSSSKVLYIDGVHPQHNSKAAYGWIQKGKEKILKANSGRKRLNINGALDPEAAEVMIDVTESVNSESTIRLFQQVEKRYPEATKIIMIADNAKYHKSKSVKDYLENSRIELRFLPPYSPNLNLIERFWRFLNKKVRNNRYYEKFCEFKEAILNFFKNIHLHKRELRSLLVKNFNIINV